ncbi:MAG: serine/threonine protein kinase [Cyanobacteria bacterium HKST-UBA02]|nr:serine/threonine protein kinase [Cyanobacteria bacterium HKST-UBA02]
MTGEPEPDEKETRTDSTGSGRRRLDSDPFIGATLADRFVIEGTIGTGGMSVVYKAKQLNVDRYVAIKTLKLRVDTKPVFRERFRREIESLCALSHPNIVTVYDCIIGEDDQPYIIMDYLRGRSLEKLLHDEGPLALPRFVQIFSQVLSALGHAHERGVIHRDIKPGNIVLMDDEMDFVKVVDFGLARIGRDERKLTNSGELWGSPPYMSPEQCAGESGDHRSDIYSMGCVMFELLMGVDPFASDNIIALVHKHLNDAPPAFASINPRTDIPPALEQVVMRALCKNPDERFQSAGEMRKALLDCLDDPVARLAIDGASSRTVVTDMVDHRGQWLLAAITVLLIVVAVVGFSGAFRAEQTLTRSPEPESQDVSTAPATVLPVESPPVSTPVSKTVETQPVVETKPPVQTVQKNRSHTTGGKTRSRARTAESSAVRATSVPAESSSSSAKKDPWSELRRLKKDH